MLERIWPRFSCLSALFAFCFFFFFFFPRVSRVFHFYRLWLLLFCLHLYVRRWRRRICRPWRTETPTALETLMLLLLCKRLVRQERRARVPMEGKQFVSLEFLRGMLMLRLFSHAHNSVLPSLKRRHAHVSSNWTNPFRLRIDTSSNQRTFLCALCTTWLIIKWHRTPRSW